MRWPDRIGRRLKLRDLHVVLAVAESGSMAKAAADLAIFQPSVSKAIADIEHLLGLRLFDRGPRGIEPTIYGRALVNCGLAVFDELRQGDQEFEFLVDPTAGELRIGCNETLAAGFVSAIIERLSRQYPRVAVHVVPANRDALLSRELPQRSVDLRRDTATGVELGRRYGGETPVRRPVCRDGGGAKEGRTAEVGSVGAPRRALGIAAP